MIIDRMQIEEGFLDGLDLRLVPGLNVIIGARGTGKTSIIELIRYGLGAQANTAEAIRTSTDHANSVLGSGQVTLTLKAGSATTAISRGAGESAPRANGEVPRVIIFAQSEIEKVGLLPDGRLRIVDGFITNRAKYVAQSAKLVADIRAATGEMRNARKELAELAHRREGIEAVNKALEDIAVQEARIAATSQAATLKSQELEMATQQIVKQARAEAFLADVTETASYWADKLADTDFFAPSWDKWEVDGEPDPIGDLRTRFREAEARLSQISHEFQKIKEDLLLRRDALARQRIPLEDRARALRREIEMVQQGAGQIYREVSKLRERQAQLDALMPLLAERTNRLKALQDRRGSLLDAHEALLSERFQGRLSIAKMLNGKIGPRVKVTIVRGADLSAYERVLVAALRGSGLRYSELAANVARAMSPRELLEAVELGKVNEIALACGITLDRASKLTAQLFDEGLPDLAACILEDEANFFLLDGGDYKNLAELSTGQRCTVILPILLEHRDRILVFDQPEDHIDNAFIAETVIKALASRSQEGQIIISTHNANIPVLGAADIVVHMASDGRRGYVQNSAPLERVEIIDAITSLMEGGKSAFERRAQIYRRF